jgi:hypothetical protein
MLSFPALPGRYQVMTARCWPGTCWKATGTSPVNAVTPSDGRRSQRANPSREPCGRKLSKRVLNEAGNATRPFFCLNIPILLANDDQRARHSRVAVTGQIANEFIFSGGLLPLFMRHSCAASIRRIG